MDSVLSGWSITSCISWIERAGGEVPVPNVINMFVSSSGGSITGYDRINKCWPVIRDIFNSGKVYEVMRGIFLYVIRQIIIICEK